MKLERGHKMVKDGIQVVREREQLEIVRQSLQVAKTNRL